ncbi:chemotaxis protein CheW [Deltaproteobacteria bacterium TL4]
MEQATQSGISDMEEDTLTGMYLTFCLDKQSYGLEIRHIIEIIRMQPVTEVPDVPEYVMGVINLRGKVIPVMDVRKRFNMPYREYTERTCIIVLSIEDLETGLCVDYMEEVTNIPESRIQSLPSSSTEQGDARRYIKGLGKLEHKVVILLDVNKIIFIKEAE